MGENCNECPIFVVVTLHYKALCLLLSKKLMETLFLVEKAMVQILRLL